MSRPTIILAVLACAAACRHHPAPEPDIRIGVTQIRGADISEIEAALLAVNARTVPLIERTTAAAMVTLDSVDGLLLGPGQDIEPSLYGELPHESINLVPRTRQEMDIALAREAARRDMPILGLCLGAQELAVAFGGSLIQDVPSEIGDQTDHRAPHALTPTEGSLFSTLYEQRAQVSSNHHQAVDRPGRHLVEGAHAPDGTVEALYAPDHLFVAGVQFHPERRGADLTDQTPLWQAFATAVRTYKERGEAEVSYTEPGSPAPAFHVCEAVQSPFMGGSRRDIETLGTRKISDFGDHRISYVKGHKHGGIDLKGTAEEEIFAICRGKVVDKHLAFPHLTVVVEHIRPDGSTVYSSYKHIEEAGVAVGDLVDEQTRIGRLFTAEEFAASPFRDNHLHFELRTSIEDGGAASWTSMTMQELKRYAIDPWAFFKDELGSTLPPAPGHGESASPRPDRP